MIIITALRLTFFDVILSTKWLQRYENGQNSVAQN